MSTAPDEGYLVLADISGYTSFLAKTELDHAHEILTELLELIVNSLTSVMTLSKLEGDAVFAYAPADKIPRGEEVLELVESTYVAFRNRTQVMHNRTTCTCNACRNIPNLDLKFITHYGAFILQKPVAGRRELVGSDVNLAHRLLKNHVAEDTSWHAYALFTEKTLDTMGVHPEKMHAETESYEHLGDVNTFSLNLRDRYAELNTKRQLTISEGEADMAFERVTPLPPSMAWDWLVNPIKRDQWGDPHAHWMNGARPGGRIGPGATNHCAHGKDTLDEKIIDWKPFDYLSNEMKAGPFTLNMAYDLLPVENGTRVRVTIRAKSGLPRFIGRPIFKLIMIKMFKFDQSVERYFELSSADHRRLSHEAAALPDAEPKATASV